MGNSCVPLLATLLRNPNLAVGMLPEVRLQPYKGPLQATVQTLPGGSSRSSREY